MKNKGGNKIRIADYLFKTLTKHHGVDLVFMISGGGAIHLNDAIGNLHDRGKLRYVCHHHEQAAAIAAEGYSRAGNRLAVVCVTTGPGGLNTLTGVMGQWTDSVPVLYISGQVKQETTIQSCPDIPLRQLGDQEVDIISIVKPLVKYSKNIIDPLEAGACLEEAVFEATTMRPGPVWLNIPLDIQGAMVEESALEKTRLSRISILDRKKKAILDSLQENASRHVDHIVEKLLDSKRPVIIGGRGVKIAGAGKELLKLASLMKIPLLSTFNGMDIIPDNHPSHAGKIGTMGSRSGNFALQNSDLVLSVGSRNNIRQVSYSRGMFARNAYRIVVDIDAAELKKPTLNADLQINTDAGILLGLILEKLKPGTSSNSAIRINMDQRKKWLKWCLERKARYPVVLDEFRKSKSINPYLFSEELTKEVSTKDIIVAANGTACVSIFQAGITKKDSTMIWNSGCATMGYDLSAAIGAWFSLSARDRLSRRVICIAGDGSIMMNLQELETISFNKIPIKIFIFNNNGYASIKQTQEMLFNGKYVASGPDSGVGFPYFTRIARAFGIPSLKIDRSRQIPGTIQKILQEKGPFLCEVVLDPACRFMPKLSSERLPDGKIVSKPLEDMWPFLPREEFQRNIL